MIFWNNPTGISLKIQQAWYFLIQEMTRRDDQTTIETQKCWNNTDVNCQATC